MVSSGGGMTDDSDGWELKQTVQVVVGHTFEQTEPASQPPIVSRVLAKASAGSPTSSSQSPTKHVPFLYLDLDLDEAAFTPLLHVYRHMMRTQAVTTSAQPCLLPR